MNYLNILSNMLLNNELDYNNKKHIDIVFLSLIEFGIDDCFLINETFFKEMFYLLRDLNFKHRYINIEPGNLIILCFDLETESYEKLTITNNENKIKIFREINKSAFITKHKIECFYNLDNAHIIIKTHAKKELNNQYSSICEQFIESELNDLGFYIIEKNKTIIKPDEKTEILSEYIRKRDEENPLIKEVTCINNNILCNYYADLGNTSLNQVCNSFCNESEIPYDILLHLKEVKENIEDLINKDLSGRVKEYYKKRYKDYPEIINNIVLSKSLEI